MRSPTSCLSLALAAAVALTLLPGAARADVVGPPPTTCLPGSLPSSCHGGPYCELLSCQVDTDCKDGMVCAPRPLCTTPINCGSGWSPPDAAANLIPAVAGSCAGGIGCEAGAACSTVRVCVDGSASSSSASGGGSITFEKGCSCGLAGGREGSAAGALLGVAVAALVRWRRDQRASRQRRA